LGIGDWGLGPIPNPQSPIPNPQDKLDYKNLSNNKMVKLDNSNNKYRKRYNTFQDNIKEKIDRKNSNISDSSDQLNKSKQTIKSRRSFTIDKYNNYNVLVNQDEYFVEKSNIKNIPKNKSRKRYYTYDENFKIGTKNKKNKNSSFESNSKYEITEIVETNVEHEVALSAKFNKNSKYSNNNTIQEETKFMSKFESEIETEKRKKQEENDTDKGNIKVSFNVLNCKSTKLQFIILSLMFFINGIVIFSVNKIHSNILYDGEYTNTQKNVIKSVLIFGGILFSLILSLITNKKTSMMVSSLCLCLIFILYFTKSIDHILFFLEKAFLSSVSMSLILFASESFPYTIRDNTFSIILSISNLGSITSFFIHEYIVRINQELLHILYSCIYAIFFFLIILINDFKEKEIKNELEEKELYMNSIQNYIK
jgi:hypothetical protein